MKKSGLLILKIVGIVIGVFSLVLLVLECRLLFSGEIALYANPALGITSCIFKILAALVGLASSITPFLLKKKEEALIYQMIISILLVILGIIIAFVMASDPGYARIPFLVLPPLYLIGFLLFDIGKIKEDKALNK